MSRRLLPAALGFGVCALLGLLLSAWPEGQSRAQQPTSTTDQKLDEILKKLTQIEARVAALEKSATGPERRPAAPAAAAPMTLAALNRLTRRATAPALSALPILPEKPTPHVVAFNGCGQQGDAGNGHEGDPDLNFLKNRDDVADNWIKVDFDAVLNLPFPTAIGKQHRADWSAGDLAAVQKFEGLPVSIVCFFAWARDEKEESCNCHAHDKSMFDIHTWLVKESAQIDGNQAPDRSQAVVAEVTPRLKPDHPQWTQNAIRRLARTGQQVRVSGWLMMDQEHPEQIKGTPTQDPTRGTLWEIHPIMGIEVMRDGNWVPLDDL